MSRFRIKYIVVKEQKLIVKKTKEGKPLSWKEWKQNVEVSEIINAPSIEKAIDIGMNHANVNGWALIKVKELKR